MRQKLISLPLLRRLSYPPRRPRPASPPALRGNMHRVIVLKPEGEIFQEAVFVLRDDYFPAGISRQEILRQAYSAAESCLEAHSVPAARSAFPSPLAAFLSGCACTLLASWLLGLF